MYACLYVFKGVYSKVCIIVCMYVCMNECMSACIVNSYHQSTSQTEYEAGHLPSLHGGGEGVALW